MSASIVFSLAAPPMATLIVNILSSGHFPRGGAISASTELRQFRDSRAGSILMTPESRYWIFRRLSRLVSSFLNGRRGAIFWVSAAQA